MDEWKKIQENFYKQVLRATEDKPDFILAKKPLSSAERMSIYQNSYAIRMEENLAIDFPSTQSALGIKKFSSLAKKYFEQYPSRFISATDIGRYFPDFMDDQKLPLPLGYIPDLTRLEWLLVESFYAPEDARQGLDKIASASEQDWKSARFTLSPALRFFESYWALDEIHANPMRKRPKLKERQYFLLFRVDGFSRFRRISSTEKEILQALYCGKTLEEACYSAHDEAALQSAMENFSLWLSASILESILWT